MILGACLARNEADRYLAEVLHQAKEYCDEVVVLDDGSDDITAETARKSAAVFLREESGAWGNESPARAELWQLAAERTREDGWIYIFDADHLLTGITPDTFRTLTHSDHHNAWAFPLYDCWDSPDQHRVDGYWQAWRTPRVWFAKAKPTPDFQPEWPARGIHCGHLPSNYPLQAGIAPAPAGILHLGYIKSSDREAKAQQYLALAP